MGVSYLDSRYRIDGLLATESTVLDNLQKICNAAGTWLTYDIHEGKWSVIINRAGLTTSSFNDSNIIGPININGTGLYNLYNKVTVTFPHEDLNNQLDTISIEIPPQDRNANEPDNTLELRYDIVTNPVQAQLLGFIELKQSRVDKVITFKTDYSKIGVKAGDIIDITNSVYGFVNKKFRVITVREIDADEGAINLEITALEYDEEVYDETNLNRYIRSTATGIKSIGAIDAPDQPTVTTYSNVARPRIDTVTQVNNGVVDAVEFWITYDVPPAVVYDENRTYKLLDTVRPQNGGKFNPGDEVTLSVDSLSAGNFLIKARAKNADAVSPFSTPSGQVYYNPVQTTDAIGPDTQVTDGNGNLLTAVGISTLLSALASAYDEGTGTISGSGGAGGGSTFLLLKIEGQYGQSSIIQNNAQVRQILIDSYGTLENAKAQDPVLWETYSDRLQIIARIVPPAGVTPIIPGLAQDRLPKCVGNKRIQAGSVWAYPNAWPQFYYHKMIYLWDEGFGSGHFDPARPGDVIGVDLDVYRGYFPEATDLTVEIRAHWIKQKISGGIDSVYAPVVPPLVEPIPPGLRSYPFTANSAITGTGDGTPIRVRAEVWTGANELISTTASNLGAVYDTPVTVGGNLISTGGNIKINPVGSWNSNGVGYSSPKVVSSYIDLVTPGEPKTIPGELLCRFKYDFTKGNSFQRPSFDNFDFDFNSLTANIQVPTSWRWKTDTFGEITGVEPLTTISLPSTITLGNILGYNNYNDRQMIGKPIEYLPLTMTAAPIDAIEIPDFGSGIGSGGPGLLVTEDQAAEGVYGTSITSQVVLNVSVKQYGPQTSTHQYVPYYATQFKSNAYANAKITNTLTANSVLLFGAALNTGPDDGHFNDAAGYLYTQGAFYANVDTSLPLSVLSPNLQSNIGTVAGVNIGWWVDKG